jgi:hypothetical protein
MDKKQIIELICIIAGITLVIKTVDYLQFVISGIFQLIAEQGYAQLYYFFIYLTAIAMYIVVAYILLAHARGIAREISKRLDPTDILIDLNASSALQYAIIIIGGITLITGLSNFLANVVTSVTFSGEFTLGGNLIWLNGLIKTILGVLAIVFAKPLVRIIQ